MKDGTWVQIVFYRDQRRFVVRGKRTTMFRNIRRVRRELALMSLKNPVFMNGYVPRRGEVQVLKDADAFMPQMRIQHIRRLSKEVALAMEL